MRKVRADAPLEMRDLTWTQKSVLRHLEKGRATSADLARREGVTPQSMAVAITVLAQKGLLARKAHPTDRRQKFNTLTSKGVALRTRVKEARETWISRTFQVLDRKEKAILSKATKLMRKMAESK